MASIQHTAILLFASSAVVFAEPDINIAVYSTSTLGTSSEALASHGVHAHDPNEDFTLQGLEFSLAAAFTETFSVHANYNTFLDEDNELTGEWEDFFAKGVLFDGQFELRAGRIFNRITAENQVHAHGWNFVNASLLTTRFGGEEGLLSEGAELQYKLPFQHDSFLSVSLSDVIADEHHEEEEEEEGEDHIEGEEAVFGSQVVTVALRGKYLVDDFNHLNYRAHFSSGENGFGKNARLYGVGLQYEWREGGFSTNQRYLLTGFEVAYRDLDFASESGDITGDAQETGVSLSTIYGFAPKWELGGRYEYLEGVDELEETPELSRFSLAISRSFELNEVVDGKIRLQVDHEDRKQEDDSTAAWLQFNLNFGAHH